MSVKIFVYGTLKYGFGNHGVLGSEAKFICKDSVKGFEMRSLRAYPAVVPCEGSVVNGEVWSIPELQLHNVDRLEGYRQEDEEHGFYDRTTVLTENGNKALMYYMTSCEGEVVESGEWI